MVDPTLSETLFSAFGVIVMMVVAIVIFAGISVRLMGWGKRVANAGNSNAEMNAQILMAENLHLHHDPTAPVAEYGAVNEAREMLQRRR